MENEVSIRLGLEPTRPRAPGTTCARQDGPAGGFAVLGRLVGSLLGSNRRLRLRAAEHKKRSQG